MKKMKKGYLSLKTKIFLANTAVAVVILTFFWFVCSELFYNTMTKRAKEDYHNMLNIVVQNVNTIVDTVEDYTKVIAQSRTLQEEIKVYLQVEEKYSKYYKARLWAGLAEAGSDIINPSTIASGMAVFIGEEVVYSGYNIPIEAVYAAISQDDIKMAYQKQKPVWNSLTLLKTSNPYDEKQYVFPVSKLIRDKNSGEDLGVVTLFVSESYFSATYEKGRKSINQSSYYIIDENENIISSFNKRDLYQRISQVLGLSEEQYQTCIERGNLIKKESGVPVLYSCTESQLGWRMFSVTNLEDLAQEQARMRQILLFILAVACLMLLYVSWLVARTVTKPVYQLLDTMNQIEEHQKISRVSAKMGGEMGMLADEFNSLMDSLEASQQAFFREQKLKRENEYKLLQAQINPHFLYNTMETISSFIKLNMSTEALTALRSLVNFYRLSLSNGREIITVKEEICLTESYIKLQGLRYFEYMDFKIDFAPTTHTFRIPKLTIQPLVENAIYHGIKESRTKGLILINGINKEDQLIITVYDTGKGIKPKKLEEIQRSLDNRDMTSIDSFGLGNISQRLNLLYGDKYQMRIESVYQEYTRITICIPLEGEVG